MSNFWKFDIFDLGSEKIELQRQLTETQNALGFVLNWMLIYTVITRKLWTMKTTIKLSVFCGDIESTQFYQ